MDDNKNLSNQELPEEDFEVVELVDEDGNTVNFRHVATIDYNDEWFVFFSPEEEMDGITDDEVVIFKLGADENGQDVFLPIEDEKLIDAVYNEYVRMIEEDNDDEHDHHGGGCSGCSGCGGGDDDSDDDGDGDDN